MGQTQKTDTKETTDQTSSRRVTDLEDFTPQFKDAIAGLQGFQKGTTKAFSTGFNPIVQNAVSAGEERLKSANAANQRDTARNLSTAGTGNNSSLLAALSNLGTSKTALARNALVPQALQQQREFDVADRQASAQAGQTQAGLLNVLGGLVKARAGAEERQTGEATRKSKTKSGFSIFV